MYGENKNIVGDDMICIVSIDDLLFRRNRTQCELLGLNVVKVPGIPWHEVTRDLHSSHTDSYREAVANTPTVPSKCGG